MIHLALAIALGILLVPIILQLCALALLIVCAPFALIARALESEPRPAVAPLAAHVPEWRQREAYAFKCAAIRARGETPTEY